MESSTTDMSSARGGRRKQAKPQRKNVDLEGNAEDVIVTSVEASVGDREDLPPLSHDSNHNHPLVEPLSPNQMKDIAATAKLSDIVSTTDDHISYPTNGIGLHGLLRMHVVKDVLIMPRLIEGRLPKRDDEEEKIQEYLQRSDTAVVFPEAYDVNNQNVPGLPGATKVTANGDDHTSGSGSEYFIKCPQCQKGYSGFQALKEHVEAFHPQQQPSPQPHHSGSQPTSPGSPAPSCGGSGGYAYSQSNNTFLNKDQMEKHELLNAPNAQVKCKICNKNFANVYRLQRHMISHDESAILRKFKCPECEKAFKFKHHLKEHIRIHSGEKPFECANCGKRFSHSGSYSSHMTSKKCLVMNLKVGRSGRTSSTILDKTNSQNRNAKRGPIMAQNNNNNFSPIFPKYRDAAAFLSAVAPRGSYPPAPSLHPFYMAAAPTMHLNSSNNSPINPYKLTPALSHLLEQLTSSSQHQPRQSVEIKELKADAEDMSACKEDLDNNVTEEEKNKGNTRCESPGDRHSPGQGSSSGDLEAVKRILETVNATVTKQFLVANMKKLSSTSSGSGCPSIASAASPNLNGDTNGDFQKDLEVSCRFCQKKFTSAIDLHQHERYLCESQQDLKEGLAAKLEEAVTVKTEELSLNGGCSGSEDLVEEEDEGESITTTDQVSEDGRKVRVRSLIADEQLAVLKGHYAVNPRPKKDELLRIAERIGFPVRVVQVWFQNTRARDRREGRLVHIPYVPLSTIPFPPVVPSTLPTVLSYSTTPSPVGPCPAEQPLDLSTKKSQTSLASTPSSSPLLPGSNAHHSDSGEETGAMNLSSKSSRSPTPSTHIAFRQLVPFSNNYQHSSCSSGGSLADFRRSPSPITSLHLHNDLMNGISNSSRLARILAQPPITSHRLMNGSNGNISIVPMDRLIYNSDMNSSRSPLPMFGLGMLNENGRPCSSSPSSDKRSWKQSFADEYTDEADDSMHHDDDGMSMSKRHKMSPGLKGGVQNLDQEPEGQFICDQCDKAFSKQSSLARHKYEHSGQRPHKCDVCIKAFKHKHHLTEHKRLHSGEKPFQCSKCLKRFSHSGSYSQHMNHRYSYCKPYRE